MGCTMTKLEKDEMKQVASRRSILTHDRLDGSGERTGRRIRRSRKDCSIVSTTDLLAYDEKEIALEEDQENAVDMALAIAAEVEEEENQEDGEKDDTAELPDVGHEKTQRMLVRGNDENDYKDEDELLHQLGSPSFKIYFVDDDEGDKEEESALKEDALALGIINGRGRTAGSRNVQNGFSSSDDDNRKITAKKAKGKRFKVVVFPMTKKTGRYSFRRTQSGYRSLSRSEDN